MSETQSSSISLKGILLFFSGLIAGLALGFFFFSPFIQGNNQAAIATASTTSTSVAAANTETTVAGSETTASTIAGSGYRVESVIGTMPWENEKDYVDYMQKVTSEKPESLKARYTLAQRFIESHELEGAAVEGFLRTPRENFVRAANQKRAYENTWLPIGYGATITDPAVVSMMTTTLDVKPTHKVLEIGTGSGYQSAILSNLSDSVYSIEIIQPLQKETDALYDQLSTTYPQYKNIHRTLGDGYYGWKEAAPFDRIIVTCAIDHLPPPLLQQLATGGIMVVPLGPPGRQHIMEVKKTLDEKGNEVLKRRDVYNGGGVKFIPFRDEKGGSYSNVRK